MPVNVYGDVAPRTAGYASGKFLKTAQSKMVMERVMQFDPLQANKSDTMIFRRYEQFDDATSPLDEVTPPEGKSITYTDVTMTLQKYGDIVYFSRKITDHHEDPVVKQTSTRLGEQAAKTIEVVRIAEACTGTNVYYAGQAASRVTTSSPLTNADLRLILRNFNRNDAEPFTEIVSPSQMVSTEGIAPAYFVTAHTDLKSDIQNLENFVPINQYSRTDKILPGEYGKVDEFRFLLTSNFKPWLSSGASSSTYLTAGSTGTGSADVYPVLVFARDSFGGTFFQGKNAMHLKIVSPDNVQHGNEMGLKGFMSWWTEQAAAVLNEAWMARYEVCCTATPS